MKLIDSKEYADLLNKLKKANFSKSMEAIEGTLFLLCRHIEAMAPVLKKTPEKMLGDISINLVSDLSKVTPSGGTRYFQLIGEQSRQISKRQYAMAKIMRNNGASDESIFENTDLVWCQADNAFKGFIFEKITAKKEFINKIMNTALENPMKLVKSRFYIDNVLEDHALFSSYSKFRDCSVVINHIEGDGSFSPSGNQVSLNYAKIVEFSRSYNHKGLRKYLEEVFAHEIQHAVQKREGEWSRGNSPTSLSPSMVQKLINGNKELVDQTFPSHQSEDDFVSKMTELAEKYSVDDIYDAWDHVDEEEESRLNDLIDKIPVSDKESKKFRIETLQEELDDQIKNNKFNPLFWYENTIGEVYARFSTEILKRYDRYAKRPDAVMNQREFFANQFKASSQLMYISNGEIVRSEEDLNSKKSLGFIDFYENSQSTISLVENESNLATWLHESLGHYVYENLCRASSLEDAPAWIKETMDELNNSTFSGMTDKRARHELFSELSEKYLSATGVHQAPKLRAISKLIENDLDSIIDLKAMRLNNHDLYPEQYMTFQSCLNKLLKTERYDPEMQLD